MHRLKVGEPSLTTRHETAVSTMTQETEGEFVCFVILMTCVVAIFVAMCMGEIREETIECNQESDTDEDDANSLLGDASSEASKVDKSAAVANTHKKTLLPCVKEEEEQEKEGGDRKYTVPPPS